MPSEQPVAQHRKLSLRRGLIALGAVVALVIGLYYGGWLGRSSKEAPIVVSGNIEAHQSVLAFKMVQSQVVELPFDEGKTVEAGTLLARLDDASYRQQVAVDQANVEALEQQLAAAQADLEAAQHTVTADQADLTEKQRDAVRQETLWQTRVTPQQSRDLAVAAMKVAQAALRRDQALEASRQQAIEVARANLAHARETLKLSQLLVDYTVLRAPFNGVILVRQGELGEVMSAGTPVVTMADLDHVWLRAYINETDLGRIRFGQSAILTTDSYPNKRYTGRISFISSAAEFTPKSIETHAERVTLVYRIKIDVDNPGHELKPGMPADATLQPAPADGHG